MSSIYSLDNNKNLFLYTIGNNIILRTCDSDVMSRPVILGNDFASNMTDTIYNNTLYYCYQNSSGDIIIKCITEMNDLYRISSQDTPDCFEPNLISFKNNLLLLYFIKNMLDDSYCLKCILPFENNRALEINNSFPKLPSIIINIFTDCIHINIDGNLIISIDEKMDIFQIFPDTCVENLSNNITDETIQIYENQISELYVQNNTLSQELNTMTAQINQLKTSISQRDSVIDNIKSQYAELMDTATKYRDEALKWRGKCVKRGNE